MLFRRERLVEKIYDLYIVAFKLTSNILLVSSKEVVKTHNELRTRVGTPNLSGDFFLALKAKDCAESMLRDNLDILTHPCKPSDDKQGENIYAVRADGRSSDNALAIYDRGFKIW